MEAEIIERKGQIKWNTASQSDNQLQLYAGTNVEPRYSKFSESVRHLAPSGLQCRLFCGGKGCKYESGTRWKDEDMAIKGLFSHWYVIILELLNSLIVQCFDQLNYSLYYCDVSMILCFNMPV